MTGDCAHSTSRYCVLVLLAALAGLMGAVLWAAPAFTGQVQAAQPRTRVIISTDLATGLEGGWRKGVSDIDDGLAVAMALADPSLDIRGVVTTVGNNDVGPETIVATHLLQDLLGTSVPVYEGAAVRLSNPQVSWYGGAPINAACLNDGVDFMASELGRGPLTIIAIGPVTDVACLIQNYPIEAQNIDRVVAIGGRSPHQRFQIGKVSGLSDFNFAMDPRAAWVILEESTVPVTFMTFSLTSSGLVPRSALDPFRQDPTPLVQFIVGATDNWIDYWQGIFDEDGFHPWDQNAVYYVSHPEAFECMQAEAEIVPCPDASDECGGSGLNKEVSLLWLTPAVNPRVLMCTAYAGDAAKQHFLDALLAFLR